MSWYIGPRTASIVSLYISQTINNTLYYIDYYFSNLNQAPTHHVIVKKGEVYTGHLNTEIVGGVWSGGPIWMWPYFVTK